jgi:2-C-methyl-D-erythritol 2,4-cyclodiphosphate synthase
LRIGQGFDVHAFGEGDKIVLGGVVIPFEKSLRAHSDGDVLLHAICDALLGAAALGDIGKHFPDTDPHYRGANSRELLRLVVAKIHAQGLYVVNCDSTVIAERPRLANIIPQMINNIASDLRLAPDCVNVKATTSEKLGFTGREEGIAAQAVVLLESRSDSIG